MRKLALIALVVSFSSSAYAQAPGDAPPYPPPPPDPQPYPQPPPPPQPMPQPQPYAQPPQGYPQGCVPVQLTRDEHELLQKGEITDNQMVGGIAANIFLGFGIGQAIQGRYGDTGWIFTVGEIASITALFVGFGQALGDCFEGDATCNDNRGEGLMIGGLIGYLGFRLWSIVDAASGPGKHNRKVRELRMRLGIPQPMFTQRVIPYVNRTRDQGATAGLVFRF